MNASAGRRDAAGSSSTASGQRMSTSAGGAGLIDTERDDRPARLHRTDAFDQLQQPEPRELVAGVVGEAEQADQILDVRGFEEPQPAVLHVGDAPARQLELEQIAVVRGAHEHRLLAQRDALLAMGEDLLAHRVDLRVLVGAAHEPRPFAAGRLRPQPRHEPSGAPSLTALATSRIGCTDR